MTPPNASLLIAFRRDGFRFDPTQISNWFGGIVGTLQARSRPSCKISALADQTLKHLHILTRGSRRSFILKQVERAIHHLCTKEVLLFYNADRVKLHPKLTSDRLAQYQKKVPLPWESKAWPEKNQSDDDHGAQMDIIDVITANDDGVAEPVVTVSDDHEDAPDLAILPGLRGFSASNDRLAIVGNEVFEVPSTSPCRLERWAKEAADALEGLFPKPETLPGGPTPDPMSARLSTQSCAEFALETTGADALCPLDLIINAIARRDPTLRLSARVPRAVTLSYQVGESIDLKWRPNGEVRVFVQFLESSLRDVLMHIGRLRLNAVVAIDSRERCGLQRTIEAGTPPDIAAEQILHDVSLLDDVLGPKP